MFTKKLQKAFLKDFLHNIMRKCDQGTWEHSIRVGKISQILAQELGFNRPEVSYIAMAGLLHDVGKVFMPEMVNYPGKLANNEQYMISCHPQLGLRFININWSDLPAQVTEGIILHHERLNGTGYPFSLKGDDVTLPARIVAVADVFDAMSTTRPYRPPLSWNDIVRELYRPGYDPDVVSALLKKRMAINTIKFR